MKKIFAIAFVALLTGCATVQHSKTVYTPTQLIEDRRFTIDVNMMFPLSGPSKHLTDPYSLTVHGDSIISYLPYFGRGYNLPYGGGKGLNFTSTVTDFQTQRVDRKEMTRISISTRNEEDNFVFTLEVFDNGQTDISVYSRNREQISFSGKMNLEGDK